VKAFLFALFVIIFVSCEDHVPEPGIEINEATDNWIAREYFSLDCLPVNHITDLKPCDILVKPNLNWLPGSTGVPRGIGFGHAAIVIRGAEDADESALLAKVLTFESQARDVPDEFQVRQVAAYAPGDDFSFANYNFRPDNLGRFYRLRPDLTDQQRQAIIDYLLRHDNGLSSPRAWKSYQNDQDTARYVNDNQPVEYWYCSLIIWQAFYDVLGIDLDANKGLYVYPNDLINSPYFDDEPGMPEKRIRF
jgi:hypothetical protein